MMETFVELLWIFAIMFCAMLFFSYRGVVSNSRVSLFSMVIVFHEAGDDTFNTIENETENEAEAE